MVRRQTYKKLYAVCIIRFHIKESHYFANLDFVEFDKGFAFGLLTLCLAAELNHNFFGFDILRHKKSWSLSRHGQDWPSFLAIIAANLGYLWSVLETRLLVICKMPNILGSNRDRQLRGKIFIILVLKWWSLQIDFKALLKESTNALSDLSLMPTE